MAQTTREYIQRMNLLLVREPRALIFSNSKRVEFILGRTLMSAFVVRWMPSCGWAHSLECCHDPTRRESENYRGYLSNCMLLISLTRIPIDRDMRFVVYGVFYSGPSDHFSFGDFSLR